MWRADKARATPCSLLRVGLSSRVWALSRLERDIQARQTARLGASVVPLHVLHGEIDFWERYYAYLAAIAARAHRTADDGRGDDDTAEMDPAD